MATSKRTVEGFTIKMYSQKEIDETWSIAFKPLYDANTIHYTPRDNKPYRILKDEEISYDKFQATILANGKTIIVKYNICNQHKKIDQAVRKAFL